MAGRSITKRLFNCLENLSKTNIITSTFQPISYKTVCIFLGIIAATPLPYEAPTTRYSAVHPYFTFVWDAA